MQSQIAAQECIGTIQNSVSIDDIENEINFLNTDISNFKNTELSAIILVGIEKWNTEQFNFAVKNFREFLTNYIEYQSNYYNDIDKSIYTKYLREMPFRDFIKLSKIANQICALIIDYAREQNDLELAYELSNLIDRFIPGLNFDCRKYWRNIKLEIAQEKIGNNVYELILYHWKELRRDESYLKTNEFEGFEYLLSLIENEFTKESYEEFLIKLLDQSFVSAIGQDAAVLKTTIKNEVVVFYDPELSKKFSMDTIYCNTTYAYLHKPEKYHAQSQIISCDTIENRFNPITDYEIYRMKAKKSGLFYIKELIKD